MNNKNALLAGTLLVACVTIVVVIILNLTKPVPGPFLDDHSIDFTICSCNDLDLDTTSTVLFELSKSYYKIDKKDGNEVLISVLNIDKSKESFHIPGHGFGWLSMKWFPSAYRYNYRISDEESYINKFENENTLDEFIDVLNKNKCGDIQDSKYDKVFSLNFSNNSAHRADHFSSVESLRVSILNDMNSSNIKQGDAVMIKINCGSSSVVGCMDSTACNYNDKAEYENEGQCAYIVDECGVCGGMGKPVGDCDCNGSKLDASGICGGDCEIDIDEDGICDNLDECIGELDECGVCNGPGAVYECGCEEIPPSNCDCTGNKWDAIGVCGGSCRHDINGDGICDPIDRDGDGVPDNVDACIDVKADTSYGNGCPFDIEYSKGGMNFIFEGTSDDITIKYNIKPNIGDTKSGKTHSASVFPENYEETQNIYFSIGLANFSDLKITFEYYNSVDELVYTKTFDQYELICVIDKECGFQKVQKTNWVPNR